MENNHIFTDWNKNDIGCKSPCFSAQIFCWKSYIRKKSNPPGAAYISEASGNSHQVKKRKKNLTGWSGPPDWYGNTCVLQKNTDLKTPDFLSIYKC